MSNFHAKDGATLYLLIWAILILKAHNDNFSFSWAIIWAILMIKAHNNALFAELGHFNVKSPKSRHICLFGPVFGPFKF